MSGGWRPPHRRRLPAAPWGWRRRPTSSWGLTPAVRPTFRLSEPRPRGSLSTAQRSTRPPESSVCTALGCGAAGWPRRGPCPRGPSSCRRPGGTRCLWIRWRLSETELGSCSAKAVPTGSLGPLGSSGSLGYTYVCMWAEGPEETSGERAPSLGQGVRTAALPSRRGLCAPRSREVPRGSLPSIRALSSYLNGLDGGDWLPGIPLLLDVFLLLAQARVCIKFPSGSFLAHIVGGEAKLPPLSCCGRVNPVFSVCIRSLGLTTRMLPDWLPS